MDDLVFNRFEKPTFYSELDAALKEIKADTKKQLCITPEGPRALNKRELKTCEAVKMPLAIAKKMIQKEMKAGTWSQLNIGAAPKEMLKNIGFTLELIHSVSRFSKKLQEKVLDHFLALVKTGKFEEAEKLLSNSTLSIASLRKMLTKIAKKSGQTGDIQKAQNILDRIETLKKAFPSFQQKEISKIAAFVELRIQTLGEKQTEFKKKEFGLVRSLRYNPETKEVFILHKSKVRTEKGDEKISQEKLPHGTEKVAKPVTKISLLEPALVKNCTELVMRKDLHVQEKAYKAAIEETAEIIEKEAKVLTKYGLQAHNDVFVSSHMVTRYEKTREGVTVSKVSLIQSNYPETLLDVVKKGIGATTLEEKKLIMRSILKAVALLHEKGIIHYDIKLENVFIEKDTSGKIIGCRVSDFGSAFVPKDGEKPPQRSYYGTPQYTAPELFGLSKEEWPDDFATMSKAEGFAAGATLYALIFGAPLVPGQAGTAGADEKRNIIDTKITEAETKRNVTKDPSMKALQGIVLGLIAQDPAKRMSIQEALDLPFFNK